MMQGGGVSEGLAWVDGIACQDSTTMNLVIRTPCLTAQLRDNHHETCLVAAYDVL